MGTLAHRVAFPLELVAAAEMDAVQVLLASAKVPSYHLVLEADLASSFEGCSSEEDTFLDAFPDELRRAAYRDAEASA